MGVSKFIVSYLQALSYVQSADAVSVKEINKRFRCSCVKCSVIMLDWCLLSAHSIQSAECRSCTLGKVSFVRFVVRNSYICNLHGRGCICRSSGQRPALPGSPFSFQRVRINCQDAPIGFDIAMRRLRPPSVHQTPAEGREVEVRLH